MSVLPCFAVKLFTNQRDMCFKFPFEGSIYLERTDTLTLMIPVAHKTLIRDLVNFLCHLHHSFLCLLILIRRMFVFTVRFYVCAIQFSFQFVTECVRVSLLY